MLTNSSHCTVHLTPMSASIDVHLIGASQNKPALTRFMCMCFRACMFLLCCCVCVCMYWTVLCILCIHSSVIMESSLDREWIQRTVYHLQWLRQGWRPLTDLPLQWLQWWGLLRGSKDHKSVFIFPCYSVMGLCSYTACHKWSQEAQRPVQLWEMGSTRSQEQCISNVASNRRRHWKPAPFPWYHLQWTNLIDHGSILAWGQHECRCVPRPFPLCARIWFRD